MEDETKERLVKGNKCMVTLNQNTNNFIRKRMSFQFHHPSNYHHSKVKVCPYCGQSSQTVFVHGHEQCVVCKTNVEPCCQGEFPKSV